MPTDQAIVAAGSLAVNGFTFTTLTAGPKTGELVLFLHGFPQFADSWLPVMRPLAEAGFRVVAFDQRGYSAAARPKKVRDYTVDQLTSDALGIADCLGAERFHLAAHDWGGLLAWQIAAEHPGRLLSLTVLSTPHTDAFLQAAKKDKDQRRRSRYIPFFRLPFHIAERVLLTRHAKRLRSLYQGKLTIHALERNVQRLSEGGTLTAALNWYRALSPKQHGGAITTPTLYMWGDQDVALGEAAALATASYVQADYQFERLHGASHWLIEDACERVVNALLTHLERNALGPRSSHAGRQAAPPTIPEITPQA